MTNSRFYRLMHKNLQCVTGLKLLQICLSSCHLILTLNFSSLALTTDKTFCRQVCIPYPFFDSCTIYLYLATSVCNVYFIPPPSFWRQRRVASAALIVKLHSLRVDRCGGATLAFLLVAAPRGRPHFLIQFVIAVHCTGRLAARFVPTARNFFPLKTAQGTSFFGLNVKCEPIWSKLGVCYTGVFVL